MSDELEAESSGRRLFTAMKDMERLSGDHIVAADREIRAHAMFGDRAILAWYEKASNEAAGAAHLSQLESDEREAVLELMRLLLAESDRGVVLSTFSYLEEMLTRTVESVLRTDVGEHRFAKSFDAKLHLAHALGLIGDVLHQELINLKRIRNTFAHQWKHATVDAAAGADPKLAAFLAALAFDNATEVTGGRGRVFRCSMNAASRLYHTRRRTVVRPFVGGAASEMAAAVRAAARLHLSMSHRYVMAGGVPPSTPDSEIPPEHPVWAPYKVFAAMDPYDSDVWTFVLSMASAGAADTDVLEALEQRAGR